MNTMWKVLTRKKILDPITTEQSQLGRVLNTFDLTALGVGSTLGVGVYVLAGQVAKETAGPSVVLSFLIATIASVFAGLCYAEFGARAPRAGSAYIYSYVCIGEFIAFVIGWNLILEYVIGSASVARGLSLYLDTLTNNTLKDTFREIAPINLNYMSEYFDFFALGVSLFFAVALAFGMKESSVVNNIFTFINLSVVIFVVIAGSIKADVKNWDLPPPNNTNITNVGSGGFFPFGVEGMIKGAATCFYGFVGFDCIATTGEEVKNPRRAIPLAIIISLFIIFLAYFSTSTVITLMVPYYLQDKNAPIPHAFESVGWEVPKWIVAIGGIFALCASLFGAMFPLPRIIYAMASDGIIFRFLGVVNARFKTPVIGTILAGILTGLMAALFDLKQLVNMMSIGTLLAYTIVAASILLLRYTENRSLSDSATSDEETNLTEERHPITSSMMSQIVNWGGLKEPTSTSEKIVAIEIGLYCVFCVLIGLCAMYLKTPIGNGEIWAIVLTSIVIAFTVLILISIATQPKSRKELKFKVPLVPVVPALSILVNIYLMLMLDVNTWIRFGVWMAVGIPTYYFSVRTHFDARNESISSKTANGYTNGRTNLAYTDDEPVENVPKKKPAPPPPSLEKTEPYATIRVLDEILEQASNDRRASFDTISSASNNMSREENVIADVHHSDVPNTPVIVVEKSPLDKALDPTHENLQTNADIIINNLTVAVEPVPENTNVPLSQSLSSPANSAAEVVKSPTESAFEDVQTTIDPQLENLSGSVNPNPENLLMLPEPLQVEEKINPPSPPLQEKPEIILPVADQEYKQVEEDEINIVKNNDSSVDNYVIPPPPPMSAEINGSPEALPRFKFEAGTFARVTLRPIKKLSESPPVVEDVQQDYKDNFKFGTDKHKEFLEKLNRELYQNMPVIPAYPRKSTSAFVYPSNEDVIEESVDKAKVKEVMTQVLEKQSNSLPFIPIKGEEDNDKDEKIENNSDEEKRNSTRSNDHDKDYLNQHRENMKNVFGSIKLKKVDSFNDNEKIPNGVIKSSPSVPIIPIKKDDELRHRQNMGNVFKSIRLRKVDSFKTEEK